jgi:hypothetical protein
MQATSLPSFGIKLDRTSMVKLRGRLICFSAFIGILTQPGLPPAYSQTANPVSASPTAEAQSLLDHGRVDEALKTFNALASVQPKPAGVRSIGIARTTRRCSFVPNIRNMRLEEAEAFWSG